MKNTEKGCVSINSRVRASPPSASWDRSRGRGYGCGISPTARRTFSASRRWGRSVYDPPAFLPPPCAAAGRTVSEAPAPVPGPRPRPPPDAAGAPDGAAPPRLRPQRPHLRTPIAPPAEDRQRPHRVVAAARESVAGTTDNRHGYPFPPLILSFFLIPSNLSSSSPPSFLLSTG